MKILTGKKVPFLVIIAVSLVQTNCQKNNDKTLSYEVKIESSSTLGNYLADKNGYTLYYFSNDYQGRTTCLGDCAATWPAFYVANLTQANIDPNLDIADFDTIVVNGVSQLRYKTWPLYYYAPLANNQHVREMAGMTSGEGVGNIWYVGKPDYSIMLVNAQLKGLDGKDYTGNYVEGTGKTLYFSDPKGVTLYVFSKDSSFVNKFTKSDLSNNSVWPIYNLSEIVVPSTLDKALFDTIHIYGLTQLTYKGWPLYYFGQDNSSRGNTKGVSVPLPGIWPVAVKDLPVAPTK